MPDYLLSRPFYLNSQGMEDWDGLATCQLIVSLVVCIALFAPTLGLMSILEFTDRGFDSVPISNFRVEIFTITAKSADFIIIARMKRSMDCDLNNSS